MLPSAGELTEHKELKLLKKTAPCHMAALARYYRKEGLVGASAQSTRCVWGAACLGMVDTPERLEEGLLYLPFTETLETGKNLHRSIGMIGDQGKRYGAIMMGALDLLPVEPDAVVMYMNPAQALRLVIAQLYQTGEGIENTITGQVSLCTSIRKVLEGKEFLLDLPCGGDRAYGMLQDQEMLVAMSPRAAEGLIVGIEGTEAMGSYPFKPFLNWQVLMRPEMETMDSDL